MIIFNNRVRMFTTHIIYIENTMSKRLIVLGELWSELSPSFHRLFFETNTFCGSISHKPEPHKTQKRHFFLSHEGQKSESFTKNAFILRLVVAIESLNANLDFHEFESRTRHVLFFPCIFSWNILFFMLVCKRKCGDFRKRSTESFLWRDILIFDEISCIIEDSKMEVCRLFAFHFHTTRFVEDFLRIVISS